MLGDSNLKRVGRRQPAAGGRVGGPPPDIPKSSLTHYRCVDLRMGDSSPKYWHPDWRRHVGVTGSYLRHFQHFNFQGRLRISLKAH